MKSFILFVTFMATVFFACKDDPPPPVFMPEGQITGPDMRVCICCCGGWFLETSDTTFLFRQLPPGSHIDLDNATFPIPVKFNYMADTLGWPSTVILTRIELQ